MTAKTLLTIPFFATIFLAGSPAGAQPAETQQGENFAGITDRGAIRPQNEDSFTVIAERGFYVLADGMGGHAAGEVASKIAVDTAKEFANMPIWNALDSVWPMAKISFAAASYHEANRRILQDSMTNAAHRGMGTTMVSVLLRKNHVEIINVGDSRAYRVRDGIMTQISHDQSLVQQLIDEGKLRTQAEIDAFPYKNIITQAMGTQPKIIPDIFSEPRRAGDIYMLCSDGLTNELSDAEILNVIQENAPNWVQASQTLVDKAKAAGGRDNITVVLLKIAE